MTSLRRHRRILSMLLGLMAIAALGLLINLVPRWELYSPTPALTLPMEPTAVEGADAEPFAASSIEAGEGGDLSRHFSQGVKMLQAGNPQGALIAIHQVLALAPRMPEAHINMGYALLGLDQSAAAADFFFTAIELRPSQANAYFGLAVALEQEGDLEGALGAMRTYIHLAAADPDDNYMRKARSALWEWEFRLQEGMTREDAEKMSKDIRAKQPIIIGGTPEESSD